MKKEYINEIWKPIKGYEGLYEVSNYGRIRSFDTYRKGRNGSIRFCKGRILKFHTHQQGYLYVGLWKNNKHKTYKVHRLVAQAFLPNPHNYPCVNHKDENKTNNNVDNLEWCTYEYNNKYGKMQVIKNKQKKPVIQYDLQNNFIREYESIWETGYFGFDRNKVNMCCRGKRKTHKGFLWRYK